HIHVTASSISTALSPILLPSFFFFNDTATTEIYTLSLHDALPISHKSAPQTAFVSDFQSATRTQSLKSWLTQRLPEILTKPHDVDRKSTRLNSSHVAISYAVFCLKKKKDLIADS